MNEPETILVVEDDPALLKLARILLEGFGYHVKPFDDPHDALAWVRDHPDQAFDLAISDMQLPGMNGVELCRRLAELRPSVRLILMSGYQPEEIDGGGVEDNLHFLDKPFTEESLRAKVREALA